MKGQTTEQKAALKASGLKNGLLQKAGWLMAAPVQQLLAALQGAGEEARVAGGAVRNHLLGEAVGDVDIATTAEPNRVTQLAEAAGFQVHPTGIAHGTVLVMLPGFAASAMEVTTLRRDVASDGRHASVVFTRDWLEDAKRRDLTINALYCDGHGTLFDPLGGLADVLRRRIRFVGQPEDRICEDYLRILRFFRFAAQYGRGQADEAGLKACARLKAGLARLSGERIRAELFKLVEAPGAALALKQMDEAGVLKEIGLPAPALGRFSRLAQAEEAQGLMPDALLRLAVLAGLEGVGDMPLALSNRQKQRLLALRRAGQTGHLTPASSAQERLRLLYHEGTQGYGDAVRTSWAASSFEGKAREAAWRALYDFAASRAAPVFPVRGADLLARGLTAGPALGEKLKQLEARWIEEGFAADKKTILGWLS